MTTRIPCVLLCPNPSQPKFHFKANAARATQISTTGEMQTGRSTVLAEASALAFVAWR